MFSMCILKWCEPRYRWVDMQLLPLKFESVFITVKNISFMTHIAEFGFMWYGNEIKHEYVGYIL